MLSPTFRVALPAWKRKSHGKKVNTCLSCFAFLGFDEWSPWNDQRLSFMFPDENLKLSHVSLAAEGLPASGDTSSHWDHSGSPWFLGENLLGKDGSPNLWCSCFLHGLWLHFLFFFSLCAQRRSWDVVLFMLIHVGRHSPFWTESFPKQWVLYYTSVEG